jgi:hypothetical protein
MPATKIKLFCDRIEYYLRTNGLSWTIDYLKESNRLLKCWAVGVPNNGAKWVKTRYGIPVIYDNVICDSFKIISHGVVSPVNIESLLRLSGSHRALGDYEKRLTIKSAQEFSRVSLVREGVAKLVKTVNSVSTVPDILDNSDFVNRISSLIQRGVRCLPRAGNIGYPDDGSIVRQGVSQDKALRDIKLAFAEFSVHPLLCTVPGWEKIFHPLTKPMIYKSAGFVLGGNPFIGSTPACDLQDRHEGSSLVCGYYGASVEPGYKVRGFASPFAHIKALEEPLYRVLQRCELGSGFSARLYGPNDNRIQQWLQSGKEVSSIDLTAATDRYPLWAQLTLAEHLGIPLWARELMEALSRGRWLTRRTAMSLGFPSEMCFQVGQPLGLRFSMPLFTLTQIAIVCGLFVELGREPDFRVLGDDIVIPDTQVASEYSVILEQLGVEVNVGKSYTSSHYAEFQGAMHTRLISVWPGKYRYLYRPQLVEASRRLFAPVTTGSRNRRVHLSVCAALLVDGLMVQPEWDLSPREAAICKAAAQELLNEPLALGRLDDESRQERIHSYFVKYLETQTVVPQSVIAKSSWGPIYPVPERASLVIGIMARLKTLVEEFTGDTNTDGFAWRHKFNGISVAAWNLYEEACRQTGIYITGDYISSREGLSVLRTVDGKINLVSMFSWWTTVLQSSFSMMAYYGRVQMDWYYNLKPFVVGLETIARSTLWSKDSVIDPWSDVYRCVYLQKLDSMVRRFTDSGITPTSGA